ncbi:amino acid ABC transporter substrate-binding protein (PAAT family) [Streptomyces sp. 3211.6]|uniref:ABC transporter substrate-binding protein n=1 Tax=Streptomyces TaxID=1883 RepID=UPI0009A4C2FE|nr:MULTISPECIES: ABC transporter substrate-binding protein [Streptomyces]RKT06856.1 amino acid ABC transporter substrate-binding protein (PAAT family) [Streptomyces sp. 3211.6]RPF45534.1 amino acid ABC transporter substrate-binding protein (PAAT family) [Streptomyces sp. Ag109_G2-6]
MTASTTRRTTAARSRIAAVGAIAVAGALILTGCGDQTDKSSSGTGTADKSAPLFSKLPKKIQDAGVIKVGSDTAYAPMEYVDGGKIVGVDPDIAEALGKQLGVKLQFTSGTFDGLITSLETGRQDVAISSITDNKKRQEGLDDKGQKIGKGVDFVDYMSSGVSLLVKKGNPDNIKSLDDLCGKTVAVQRGTIYEDTFKAQAEKCGDKKLTIEAFDTDADAQVRVKAGGAVADLNDFPVTSYIAKTSGGGNDFEVGGQQSDVGLFGIAVSKDNTQLRDALKEAVDAIIKDGSYAKVLEKWNVKDGAVQSATINAGK